MDVDPKFTDPLKLTSPNAKSKDRQLIQGSIRPTILNCSVFIKV